MDSTTSLEKSLHIDTMTGTVTVPFDTKPVSPVDVIRHPSLTDHRTSLQHNSPDRSLIIPKFFAFPIDVWLHS
jgi:hypothetical protein